jgi:hypothetical protein
MTPPALPPLSEASRRYLARIAHLLRTKRTVTLEIEVNDGGIRDYREVVRLKSTDLDEAPTKGDGY